MRNFRRSIMWTAKAVAIAQALLLAVFSLDALDSPGGPASRFVGLVLHLSPVWVVLLALALAWRRPGRGAILFLLLAFFLFLLQGWSAPWSWHAVIVGPLLLLACLNAAAWRLSEAK